MVELPTNLANSGVVVIVERLNSISGGKILDIGTDEGDFIEFLIKSLEDYETFIGIDLSKESILKAREKLKDHPIEIIEMNAEKLKFNDNSFDTVCMAHVLHHLDNIDKVLSEIKRVLKPNGIIILHEQYCDGDQNDAQKASILQHHFLAKIDTLQNIPHNKTLTKNQITNLINDMGIINIEILETTHSLNCYFCKKKFACDDPKNESNIKGEITGIDLLLKRVGDHPTINALKEEAEKIKRELKKNGSATASMLFIIGSK